MKAVTRYETADGASFETEAEAEAHELELGDANRVEAWLDETCPGDETVVSSRERSRRRNVVVEFLAWERGRAADEAARIEREAEADA